MKKSFIAVLSCAFMLCCTFALTACIGRNRLPSHTHDYKWVDNGDGTHKQHCDVSGCDAPDINGGDHDFSDGNCVCGKTKPAQPPEHTQHSFGDWISDGEEYHRRVCSECGETETQSHDFANGDCVCGETKPVVATAGLEYVLNQDGESYAVKGIGSATDTNIVIPSEYDGKPVTAIRAYAFENCAFLTRISIPDSVTFIGNQAFGECASLESITLSNGVTAINFETFYNCNSLKSITFGNRVASVGDRVFYGCSSLTSVTIGDKVTAIGSSAFENCTSLARISVPDSVSYIGNNAFKGCASLADITIGKNITFIQYDTFKNCPIQTASIPASVCQHVNTSTLLTVAITSGTTIQESALENCGSLTSITIGKSVTTIGKKAFSNCTGLTNIAIPDSVTAIGDYAFDRCNSLKSITVDANNPNYSSQDGILYDKAKTQFIHIPKAIAGKVTIPGGVTSIGWQLFNGYRSLTEIIISDGVTSIGFGAFYNCALTSVTIPASVISIEEEAFCACASLSVIRFQGTKAQWNAIAKEYNWDLGTGDYTVRCADGEIEKQID